MIANLADAMVVINEQAATIKQLRDALAQYTKELGTTPNKPSAKLLRCEYFGNELVYKCSRGDKLGWCDRCAE